MTAKHFQEYCDYLHIVTHERRHEIHLGQCIIIMCVLLCVCVFFVWFFFVGGHQSEVLCTWGRGWGATVGSALLEHGAVSMECSHITNKAFFKNPALHSAIGFHSHIWYRTECYLFFYNGAVGTTPSNGCGTVLFSGVTLQIIGGLRWSRYTMPFTR